MQKTRRPRGANKPAIEISDSDYNLIANFAAGLEPRSPELAEMLFNEIERATVCATDELPEDVIRLGSEVAYHDDSQDVVRRVRLVMPDEADIADGKVSIVTPVGVGLIGLKARQSIDWPCPDGRPRVLTILEVTQQP